MHQGLFLLFLCQLFHGIVQCIEQYIDVFFFILARLLEECDRIFRIALQRSLVQEDVHIVQQHAVQGRHVELMLSAFLAATFQSGCVCLHDDAHQQMDSHRFVGKTDENAMRIIAYVLLYACKLTLQEPGEVALYSASIAL